MSKFFGRLCSAAILPIAIAAFVPTGALAYNQWQMEHDQATVNQLSQEGVLSAPQAMYLNQQAYNRRAQSWMNSQGLSANSVATPYGMMPAPSTSQTRAEDRQIDKLQRDHMITWQEANSLKSQVKAQASAMLMPQTSLSGQVIGAGSVLSNGSMITNGAIMGSTPMMSADPMMSTTNPMMNASPMMVMGNQLPYGSSQNPFYSSPNSYYDMQNAAAGSGFSNSGAMLQRLKGLLNY